MCACRQSKSFLIEDILKDITTKHKIQSKLDVITSDHTTDNVKTKERSDNKAPPQNVTFEFKANLKCDDANCELKRNLQTKGKDIKVAKLEHKNGLDIESPKSYYNAQEEIKQNNMKANLDQRRNTYPLCPLPMKPSLPWPTYRLKESPSFPLDARHSFSLFTDHSLHNEQMLYRNQFAGNRFIPNPFTLRHPYGLDRGM